MLPRFCYILFFLLFASYSSIFSYFYPFYSVLSSLKAILYCVPLFLAIISLVFPLTYSRTLYFPVISNAFLSFSKFFLRTRYLFPNLFFVFPLHCICHVFPSVYLFPLFIPLVYLIISIIPLVYFLFLLCIYFLYVFF